MKYFVILLVLAVAPGCATTQSSNTGSESKEIAIDPDRLPDIESGLYQLPYNMAKSMWEPTFVQDGSPDLFAREVFAHTAMLEIVKETERNDPTSKLPAIDAMRNIFNAGYLREVVWIKYQYVIKDQPKGLNLVGLQEWLDDNEDILVQPNAGPVELLQPQPESKIPLEGNKGIKIIRGPGAPDNVVIPKP